MKEGENITNQIDKKSQEGIEKYSPLSDLAKKYGISRDYLNTLINRKKLKAKKIGRIWFSRQDWLEEYLAEDGKNKKHKKDDGGEDLPLADLAKKYGISRDYLNTLINRKKLKAKKIGRIWFSRQDWLEEYLAEDGKNKKYKKGKAGKEKIKSQEKIFKKPEPIFPSVALKPEGKKLDWIFPEKDQLPELEAAERDWRKEAREAEKEIGEIKSHIRPLEFKHSFRKFNFVSSRAKKTAIGFVLTIVAFCFLCFVPGAGASFADLANKILDLSAKGRQEALISAKKAVYFLAKKASVPTEDGAGRVAGISEAAGWPVLANVRSLAFGAGEAAKDSIFFALNHLARAQRNLSFELGREAADLTIAASGRVRGVSESGGESLAQLGKELIGANERARDYAEASKSNFLKEASRSAWSLSDLYARFVDFIIPDPLKERYALIRANADLMRSYAEEAQTPSASLADSGQAEAEREKITQTVVTKTVETKYISSPETFALGKVIGPVKITGDLGVLGNSELDGDLAVGGPARFDDRLTVLGGSDLIGGIYNSQGDLKIDDNLIVTAAMSALDASIINDLTVGNNLSAKVLSVSGDSVIGGSQTIRGSQSILSNLDITGTFSAGYAHFSSLGVSGFLSGNSVSAGEGGLISSGDAHFLGDNNYVIGNFDISKASAAAFSVGDGATSNFVVNTSSGIITLAGATTITGALDLTGAITSAGATTLTGTTTISGLTSITASSVEPALTVTQNGAGDIINLYDGANKVFAVLDGGYVGIGTTTPYALLSVNAPAGVDAFAIGSSTATNFIVDKEGNVGIGMANPRFALDITSSSVIPTSFIPTFYVSDVSTSSTGVIMNMLAAMKANPGIDSSASYRILKSDLSTDSSSAVNFSNIDALLGIITEVKHLGTGNITGGIKGGYFSASNQNTGIVGESVGGYFESWNLVGGTITNSYGGQFISGKSAGTIDNSYAGYFDASGGTKNWGIYVNAGDAYLGPGSVGIGTTSPYAKLSVAGNIAADGTITASTITATSSISAPYFTATDASATSTFAGGLAVETSGLVYDWQTGNVGIGTAAPRYNLDIYNTEGGSAGIHARANAYGTFFYGERSSGTMASPLVTPSDNVLVALAGGGYDGSSWVAQKGQISIKSDGSWSVTSLPTKITFETTPIDSASPLERLRITNSGNVGIGTTSPYEKLSVAGNITSDGSITAYGGFMGSTFTATSSISAPYFTATSLANASTFAGGFVSQASSTVTGNLTVNDLIIPDMKLGAATYSSVNDFFKLFTSAGRISGGTIIDAGSETINVAAGTGVIRIADDDTSQVKFFDWTASSSISVPANVVKYIGVEYNSGSPRIVAQDNNIWDYDTEFPLGSVINQSGDLYILNNSWWVGDGLTNVIERLQAESYTARDNHVGGLVLDVTGTRNPTLSAGTVWSRLNEFEISAKDCSGADTFYAFYQDGAGGWTRTAALSQYPVTQYDNGTGVLANMTANRYANWWVFVEIDAANNGQLMLIYPQNQYNNIAQAEAEEVPNFPTSWYEHGVLVGRILFKQGVDAPVEVQSAFVQQFTPAQAADHGNLAGLSDDDHTQYALLAGRSGGQTLYGSITADETLTIRGNSAVAGNTLTSANLIFGVGNSGATTAMTILNSGNVGIGTASPARELEVSGTGGREIRITSTTAGTGTATLELSTPNEGIWFIEADDATGDLDIGQGGNLVTIQDGGNVGIGTTTPAYLLDVDGDFRVGEEGSSNALFVDATKGAVGIGKNSLGTSLPTGWNSLNGNSRFLEIFSSDSASTYDAGIVLRRGDAMNIGTDIWVDGSAGHTYIDNRWNSASGDIRFRTQTAGTPVDVLTLTGDGNVGIGTTSPYEKLSVAGNIAADGTITASTIAATSSISAPYFTATSASATSTFAGGLAVDTSDFVVDPNSGRVGIGTISPSATLNIYGDVLAGQTTDMSGDFNGVGTNKNFIFAYDSTETNNINDVGFVIRQLNTTADTLTGLHFSAASGSGPSAGNDYPIAASIVVEHEARTSGEYHAGEMTFHTAPGSNVAPSERMRIDSSGNVGIGTTSPSGTFEVEKSVNTANLVQITNPNTGATAYAELNIRNDYGSQNGLRLLTMGTNWTDAGIFKQDSGGLVTDSALANGLFLGTRASAPINFYTNNNASPRMTIDSSGNVGIGTTSPAYLLDVDGDMRVGVVGKANTFYVDTDNERVGIGTASPVPAFEIDKSIAYTGSQIDGEIMRLVNTNNQAISPVEIMFYTVRNDTDGTNLYTAGIKAIGTRGTGAGAINSGALAFHTADGAGNVAERMRIDSSGNVGIGTASPGSKLEVSAGTSISSASSFPLQITNYLSEEHFSGIGFAGYNAGADQPIKSSIAHLRETGSAYGWGDLVFLLDETNDLSDVDINDEKMRITSDGNVGIGHSSPAAKLHIQDTTSITSFTGAHNAGLKIRGGTTNSEYALLGFASSYDSNVGQIGVRQEAIGSYMEFGTSNNYGLGITNTAMTINPSGNVGIGVSPSYPLDIKRDGTAFYGNLYALANFRDASANKGLVIGYDNTAYKTSLWAANSAGWGTETAMEFWTANGSAWGSRMIINGTGVGIGASATNPTHLIELDADTYGTTSGWTDSSDRNKKENFTVLGDLALEPVKLSVWTGNGSTIDAIEYEEGEEVNLDNNEILKRLSIMPVMQWNFINDDDYNEMSSSTIKHIGPTAQDFYKLFGLGSSDTRVRATDLAGVSLAGLKALNEKVWPIINNIGVDENGNIKLGNCVRTGQCPVPTEGGEPVVEIVTATTTSQTAFVVNQFGSGDIADFKTQDVSVMNIAGSGKVSIVGTLAVDGRIMACAGSSCGSVLEDAVDETMGDIGVEGKVVAGAFEGYCEEGFVWVPGSAKYGTMPGFCVAARIARLADTNETNLTNITNVNGQVWNNISQGEAGLACQGLGTGYHLISENEWLTIAGNIIKVASNDIDEATPGLQLSTGIDPNLPFTLTNGEKVYELAGETGEWTDRIISATAVPTPEKDSWQEYYEIDIKDFDFPPPYYLTSANGIGKILVGAPENRESSLAGFVRGRDGIYSLDLTNSPIAVSGTIGFRCAK
ncbi:MAG: helix-turn-helix domain-containing protein [Patescibacteria group bacterium]|nr:helix-turn-helix domain-containing protein [Patescibacteria group bacterium]